ncbi:PDZ domain-containing protein [Promicromonospora sp. NPDC050880]|uniref:PDZ domain-containing protein n=1 Tax=Promicromonospora sp. NPDC050880 TaxID=3364406 RepID=UPI0037A72609
MRDRQPTPQPEPAPFEDLPPEVAPVTRRTVTLGVSLLATAVLAAVALVLPTPYAMRSPGPTEDTLAKGLIEIEGARTYESSGKLLLTTVSVLGGPGYPVMSGQVIQGWLDPRRSVLPVEAIFPEATTKEEQREVSQAEMVSSQESATAAALTELGYDVPAVLDVAGTEEGSGAAGKLQEGDVITRFQGEPVGTYADLITGLAETEAGSTVTLGVRRGERTMDVDVTTSGNGQRAVLGVYIDPRYDFPVDVSIQIEDIGGPSAGTMFALGIIDRLTAEDEANGHIIAGTGTMSPEGTVGPIGGIEQKLYGAVRDRADWFLAPADNCDQVVGNVPDGLHVVKVSTLAEARDAVEQIGRGHGADLPTCP